MLFAKYFRLINSYIKSIGQQNEVIMKEPEAEYSATSLENLLTKDALTNDQ